jgi:hypothetical protein
MSKKRRENKIKKNNAKMKKLKRKCSTLKNHGGSISNPMIEYEIEFLMLNKRLGEHIRNKALKIYKEKGELEYSFYLTAGLYFLQSRLISQSIIKLFEVLGKRPIEISEYENNPVFFYRNNNSEENEAEGYFTEIKPLIFNLTGYVQYEAIKNGKQPSRVAYIDKDYKIGFNRKSNRIIFCLTDNLHKLHLPIIDSPIGPFEQEISQELNIRHLTMDRVLEINVKNRSEIQSVSDYYDEVEIYCFNNNLLNEALRNIILEQY